uniref:GRAS1 n=1 Tax=Tamarix hispida TaxID=189793 RepID=A0A2S1WLK3_9CARY|nr:GRAS1 [Tamarix hispida]
MDTLIEGYYKSKNLKFSPEDFVPSNSMNSIPQNVALGTTHDFGDSQVLSNGPNQTSSDQHQFSLSQQDSVDSITQNVVFGSNDSVDSQIITLNDLDQYFDPEILDSGFSGSVPDGVIDVGGVPDFPDACLKYMGDILMDGDFSDQLPASIEDYRALQATEKSLYDALGESYPHPHLQPPSSDRSYDAYVVQNGVYAPADDCFGISIVNLEADGYGPSETGVETNVVLDQRRDQFVPFRPSVGGNSGSSSIPKSQSPGSSNNSNDDTNGRSVDSPVSTILGSDLTNLGNLEWIREAMLNLGGDGSINHRQAGELRKEGNIDNEPRGRKNHQRDDDVDGYGDLRSSKHLTPNLEEDVTLENYDDLFLCKDGQNDIHSCISGSSNVEASGNSSPTESSKGHNKGRPRRNKKKSDDQGETVDMRHLLTQCAQAVASFDLRTANELLKQIRKHSTPYGDSTQRLAHFFADALEARLSGSAGRELLPSCGGLQIPLAEFLKAYRAFVTAVPFKRTTYFLANRTIAKLAKDASRIHIIDFGINYGVQWPCFIQNLSKRAIGPPKLRITAVDYPQRGYQPASRIEATGRQLSKYCERFRVPFEYHPIAKRWEDVRPEDLKIDRDELLVVNCMYGAGKLLDETVDESSPRDSFLTLIRKLNPDLFMHAIINGPLSAPFFITRFKEALFYFSAMFDLFEETMPREDNERLLIEREVIGKSALNVIACEAADRIERPETYKQWQVRHLKAGFKQQGFDQELVKEAKAMLRGNYHKNFSVDEDAQWVLQGWKGKILYAVSCWRPAYKD